MKIIKSDIKGLLIMEPVVYHDNRGYFLEIYNSKQLSSLGFHEQFVQDNESCSAKDVLRALHFQNPPLAQGKLVRVVKGSVLDVAVDIRKGSPWYGKHRKVLLSDQNKKMFWIPPGFAHGFISLEDDTIVNYKCTNPYSKELESSILWNDPELNIDWGTYNPIVSERDNNALPFNEHAGTFIYNED